MPVIIKKKSYYRTAEVCQLSGIGRSTLLRWLRTGVIADASYRDVRGWRLFTEADVKKIRGKANSIEYRGRGNHKGGNGG